MSDIVTSMPECRKVSKQEVYHVFLSSVMSYAPFMQWCMETGKENNITNAKIYWNGIKRT